MAPCTLYLDWFLGFFLFCFVALEQVSRTALIQDTDVTYSSKLPKKKNNQNGSHFIFCKSVPLDFSS